MLMQIFGVTNKEHYGMLWYFWSSQLLTASATTVMGDTSKKLTNKIAGK